MIKLTVFKLGSVIRYSSESILPLLEKAATQELKKEVALNAFADLESFQLVLEAWADEHWPQALNDQELIAIRQAFHKNIKSLYLEDEDAFEVRPGVQSLFSQLEKEKRWKYGIISPFWKENTQFILQSCGVFSKTKLTLSADDHPLELGQIDIISERGIKKDHYPEIAVVCAGKAGKFKKEGYTVLKPKASNKEKNYYVYPKFQEFFQVKPKKKKKKKDKGKE